MGQNYSGISNFLVKNETGQMFLECPQGATCTVDVDAAKGDPEISQALSTGNIHAHIDKGATVIVTKPVVDSDIGQWGQVNDHNNSKFQTGFNFDFEDRSSRLKTPNGTLKKSLFHGATSAD